MTYTSHGHHIPGTVMNDDRPRLVARCGGPSLCATCAQETMRVVATIKAEDFAQLFDGIPKENPMKHQMENQEKAKLLVAQYFNKKVEKTDKAMLTTDDVYVVWYTYTLGYWKALLSTTVIDGMYYELTYNREKAETYIDAYKKWENVCVPDDGPELHTFGQ